ncbi:thioredoxin domain-containing protein [Actinacidiphila glaucinigra]|uniref:Protein-disulfide isomerase n=1 Tax=Actinacidiphila glaucinigra TaxID=235986 RepID=A0A239NXB7_9ACTN|nr:thioredoxin domain-containing protein [Actinacidiphila glaucinigra]SNT59068.1 Protein-disulfide isomerase [Actinacidiphila glaucinigra]
MVVRAVRNAARGTARTSARAAAGAAVAGLVALAVTGCGLLTTDSGSPDAPAAASSPATSSAAGDVPVKADPAVLAALPARLEADGTTITVGDPAAPRTVHIYEDPRCPICKAFEASAGPQLAALAKAGDVRLQYTLASFLDDNLKGSGSKKAAGALRASVEAGTGAFATYHELLYANQPQEQVDGFTDAYLLELAGKVKGLRGAAFDSAVRKQSHADFVTASEDAFVKSGATGTPYVKIDGKAVSQADLQKLFDPVSFAALLRQSGIGG